MELTMMDFFMIAVWFFLCYTAGLYAKQKKGRNGYVYFLLALVLTPLLIWPVVELLPASGEQSLRDQGDTRGALPRVCGCLGSSALMIPDVCGAIVD
jgi:hypothetical protein